MSAQTLIDALKQTGVQEVAKVFVGVATLTDGYASESDSGRCIRNARIHSETPN